ncbi:MAG: TolB protein [Chlamydiales bacterium]|jgi:TolB protein
MASWSGSYPFPRIEPSPLLYEPPRSPAQAREMTMTQRPYLLLASLLLGLVPGACSSPAPAGSQAAALGDEPFGPMRPADRLIEKHEVHFKHLWQVTHGGQNTRPRWSPNGEQITYQFSNLATGVECDHVRVQDLQTGRVRAVSDGRGVNSVGGFLPDGQQLVFASTRAAQTDCPSPPDRWLGYVWPVDPAYDLHLADLSSGAIRTLVDDPGYDGHANVSNAGDAILFCSRRSGDLELWRCDREGGDLRRLTDRQGYEAGASWSPDDTEIVFAATVFDPENVETQRKRYEAQLEHWATEPGSMKIEAMAADGSGRRTVTSPGGANWDPCFTPDGSQILFASNHHGAVPDPRSFDLFLVNLDGSGLERVTYFDHSVGRQYDGFPNFSRNGRFLAFSSNRGTGEIGETNVFVAEWQ